MDPTPKLSNQNSQRQFPNDFLFAFQDSQTNPPFPNSITSKCKFWGNKNHTKLLESCSGATLWMLNIPDSQSLVKSRISLKNPPQTHQKKGKSCKSSSSRNFLQLQQSFWH